MLAVFIPWAVSAAAWEAWCLSLSSHARGATYGTVLTLRLSQLIKSPSQQERFCRSTLDLPNVGRLTIQQMLTSTQDQ